MKLHLASLYINFQNSINKCYFDEFVKGRALVTLQERLGWDPLQRYISDLNH